MRSFRAIVALVCVLCLGLTACVADVPWPPRDGSCIEAYRPPRRRALYRYYLAGRQVSRETVADLVYTEADRAKVRRNDALDLAAPPLIVSGQVSTVLGIVLAGSRHQPLFLLLSVGGLASIATGVALAVKSSDDPFRGAVMAYNEAARRSGLCAGHPLPIVRPAVVPTPPPVEGPDPLPPGPLAPPSPGGVPELPSKGWTP